MAQARCGRPPNSLNPDASHAAKLGAELRARRTDAGLTLQQLAEQIDYSPQHISEVERAKTTPTATFVAAVDRALDAHSAIERLLPPVLQEREERRQERAEARRAGVTSSLPCDATHSEVAGDKEDVEPTDRRGLLGAGAAAALGFSTITSAPTVASAVDPGLPAHWTSLLRLLGRHDDMFGPRGVLDIVRREVEIIAAHREVARGELRTQLMRVEARWADLAAALSEDTGDLAAAAWADRALQLARASRDPDMVAFARARQSLHVGADARATIALSEVGLHVRGASAQTRAWCARQAARGYARIGDAAACERRIADAYALLEDADSPAPPWASGYRVTPVGTLAREATCWSHLQPRKAIPLYERALVDWPRSEARDGGLYRARLAIVCATTGERERARAEGRKALAIARATQSSAIEHELRQLGGLLS